MNIKKSIPDVIPVKDESNHQEIYDNQYIRIYMATLKPGQETQYHSHHEDTLYIVIRGGEIQTINHSFDERCPNILLNQYGLIYKFQLFVSKIKKKPLKLVDRFSFFMPSATKRVVHKAIASMENSHEMLLLGVEIKSFKSYE